jgi:hypothetical protein
MREMVFRNLTSDDRRKRIIATSEVADREGVRSFIRRHFICMVKEVKDTNERPQPSVYVLKEHNSRKQKEKFFCRIKGSVYAQHKGKLYLIIFAHSLNITLTAIPQGLMQCNEE